MALESGMTSRTRFDDRIDPVMAEVLKRKSPAERLAIAGGMWRSARRLTAASLRSRHPDWSDTQIAQETAKRLSHGSG